MLLEIHHNNIENSQAHAHRWVLLLLFSDNHDLTPHPPHTHYEYTNTIVHWQCEGVCVCVMVCMCVCWG